MAKDQVLIQIPIALLGDHSGTDARHFHGHSLQGNLVPVGSLRENSVDCCGNELKEPLQTAVEAVKVQGYHYPDRDRQRALEPDTSPLEHVW
jgi:hypothetical protein